MLKSVSSTRILYYDASNQNITDIAEKKKKNKECKGNIARIQLTLFFQSTVKIKNMVQSEEEFKTNRDRKKFSMH